MEQNSSTDKMNQQCDQRPIDVHAFIIVINRQYLPDEHINFLFSVDLLLLNEGFIILTCAA
jgi:hypothetical protein